MIGWALVTFFRPPDACRLVLSKTSGTSTAASTVSTIQGRLPPSPLARAEVEINSLRARLDLAHSHEELAGPGRPASFTLGEMM